MRSDIQQPTDIMPIQHHYNPDLEILILTPEGELTIDMIRDLTNNVVFRSKEYPPNVDTIWDMRKTDYRNINKAFLEELIELRNQTAPIRGTAKLAYVADSDFEYGITRMYEMLCVDINQPMHIFRTIEEAEAWLTSTAS